MSATPDTNHHFNAAGGVIPASGNAALIVDVQLGCIRHMAPEDAANYLSSLGEQIKDMRHRQIPIAWATVDHHNNTEFHPPSGNTSAKRAPEEFKAMGFYAVAPDAKPEEIPNKEIFDRFINAYGPRQNEGVLTKPAFNAFATSEKDRVDAGIPVEAMPRINAAHKNFGEHMKDMNADNIATFGAVGSVCCLESAIGGRQNGFNTSLMLDGVVCWRGEGQKSQLVWRDGFENAEDADLWHRSEIRAATQKPERGFSESDIASAGEIRLTTYQDFIGSKDSFDQKPIPASSLNLSHRKM
ncbi:MAG: hypothetical protein DI551_06810 [Micavibrio aeruginosavorus]|uniref:Uncharacterized protein n=1 Tax=Micavibrio aeruginosavorus TaxID=349221 RepID=A0A2W5MWS2_9BACT|nr:MAG: hypothetical protein DI551_06810 [Micavibrio aeruginosavorus]